MKKTIRLLLFLVLFFAIFIGTYKILSWKDTSGAYQSTTTRLYSTEENTMDVVFTGSSHCYCSINPYHLWDAYGMSAFAMATSGQDRESTYYHMKEVLKTQHPKVFCVDLGVMIYDGYGVEGNLFRNMLSMKLSKNNIELIEAVVPEEEQMDFIIKWPIIHTRYLELQKYDFETFDYSEYGRGEVLDFSIASQNKDMEILEYDEIGELPDYKKEWLERVIQLSKDEDFELVFYTAPYIIDKNTKGNYNAIAAYLEEEGIFYIDFNQAGVLPELDYSIDFIDHGHVNTYGAEKITKYLGEFLMANFEFENHRGDAKYEVWEQDSEFCKHFIQATKIASETNWEFYVNYILNSENMVVVISLDGDYKSSKLNMFGMFVPLELECGYSKGGKWIIEDGELIARIPGDDMNPYIKDLGEDVLRVQNIVVENDVEEMFANIMVNNEEIEVSDKGLTVMIYDKILHKVIDRKLYY